MFYLIRHCATIYNEEGRIQGHADMPLSDLGRRQSFAVADAMATVPLRAIYSSPLRRALDTAEPTARSHHLPVEVDRRLMEWNLGDYSGRLQSEIAASDPVGFERWKAGDPTFVVPGGESYREIAQRGVEALREIAVRDAVERENVVVVTHGGLLATMLRELLGQSQSPFSLHNGSITCLQFDKRTGRFSGSSRNSVEHLTPQSTIPTLNRTPNNELPRLATHL